MEYCNCLSLVLACFLLCGQCSPCIAEGEEVEANKHDAPTVSIRHTKSNWHLAVMGKASLRAKDQSGKYYYFSSCILGVNTSGDLCACFGEKKYVLEPPIAVPEGTSEILVSVTGSVVALKRGSEIETLDIGQLSALVFLAPDALVKTHHPGLYVSAELQIPTIVRFGEGSGVLLMQGWVNPAIASCPSRKLDPGDGEDES